MLGRSNRRLISVASALQPAIARMATTATAPAPDPRTGKPQRLPQLLREDCTPEQAEIFDRVVGSASPNLPLADPGPTPARY